jgi:hypothetical protein
VPVENLIGKENKGFKCIMCKFFFVFFCSRLKGFCNHKKLCTDNFNHERYVHTYTGFLSSNYELNSHYYNLKNGNRHPVHSICSRLSRRIHKVRP